jgi:hypothetical protein
LRKRAPGISSRSAFFGQRLAVGSKRCTRKRASACVVDLAEVVVEALDFQPVAVRATIFHEARLSSAVPHSTAFLPPAFMAMLPPMQEASAEVGSTAKTRPAPRRLHHAPRDHAGAARMVA